MRAKWPEFRVKHRDKHQAAWEGELRPLHKTYTVGIIFRVAPLGPGVPNPVVMVLNPLLHGRNEMPDEAIPHVYGNPWSPLLPWLCLFHPPTDKIRPAPPQCRRHRDPLDDRVAGLLRRLAGNRPDVLMRMQAWDDTVRMRAKAHEIKVGAMRRDQHSRRRR